MSHPSARRGDARIGLPENAAFAIMMALAAYLSRENPLFTYPGILWAFLAFFLVNYLNFTLLPDRLPEDRRAFLGAGLNIAAIFAIVALSGGKESHFWVMYLLPIFSAAMVLERRGVGCVLGAVLLAVCASFLDSISSLVWLELAAMLIEILALTAAAAVTARFAFSERRARRRLDEELSRTSRERSETRERMQHLDRLATMGTLMASITHELRGPLTAILGAAELGVADASLGEDGVQVLSIISRSAKRCQKTIADTLAFSRKDVVKREPADLNLLLKRCLELKGFDWVGGDIAVVESLEPALPKVTVSESELQQVVFNLLNNAEQAIRSKSQPRGRIEVRSGRHDGGVRLSVVDDGPGIPPDAAKRVWEAFFTTKPAGQGTGLGLPISRSIVESHGGTLTFETEPGCTAFHIDLKLDGAA